tara:strand:+ start:227 stop:334 length:108 start_codon:yes stop_codon:yes gene_type:complete
MKRLKSIALMGIKADYFGFVFYDFADQNLCIKKNR